MKTKIILFLLFYLQNNNLFADCRNHALGKAITVTGWTPDEAYQKLHLELPKLGVFQTVDLKSVKAMTSYSYKESTVMYRSIYANIDMIATYHCRINNMYAITASIPDGSVNYYPELIQERLKRAEIRKDNWYAKLWTFESAKRYCGNKSYALITIDEEAVLEVENGVIVHKHTEWVGTETTHVVCGSGWKAKLYADKGKQFYNQPDVHLRDDGRRYVQWYAQPGYHLHAIKDWSRYMELQMLHNAMK
jgi:hypothetical protein